MVALIQSTLHLETRIDRLLPLLAHPLLPVHRSFGHREVRQQKGTALGRKVEMEKLCEGRNGIVIGEMRKATDRGECSALLF